MTQAPPDRLDRLESSVERLVEVVTAMDKKLDVHIAKTDERLNSLDTQLSDLKVELKEIKGEVKSQENRLWAFVAALFLSLAGIIVKVVFFPQG